MDIIKEKTQNTTLTEQFCNLIPLTYLYMTGKTTPKTWIPLTHLYMTGKTTPKTWIPLTAHIDPGQYGPRLRLRPIWVSLF